jgi:hypothetical protein
MSDANKTHDALVTDWRENAEKHDDDNYRFLRGLKQKSFKKVDRIALELHQEAFGIVDCKRCANCCRTLRVVVTDEDIPRIAGHVGMGPDEFIAAYLERDEEEDHYRVRKTDALRPGHSAAPYRRGVVGHGPCQAVGKLGVARVKRQERHHRREEVLDVLGLGLVAAAGVGLLAPRVAFR